MNNDDKKYFKGIRVPKDITFSETMKGTIKIHIKHPDKNMQEDIAAFEAWASIIHIKLERINVEMTFDILEQCKPLLNLNAYEDTDKQHFLRFLLRAMKFTKQMKWFSIGNDACKSCVKSFENLFNHINLVNNLPSGHPNPNKAKGENSEHILENIFVHSKEAINRVDFLTDSQGLDLPTRLYNQLPNGLFIKADKASNKTAIQETNRSLLTGFIDLWGINKNNDLCIFELKNNKNLKVGIISELYFYAHYAAEVFLTNRFNRGKSRSRGYDTLRNAVDNDILNIHAFFLAPEYHYEIKSRYNDLQKLLNTGDSNVIFHFLTYNQDEIVALSDCLPS